MPIGLCPQCGSLYEGPEEYVSEAFGRPFARWCGPCWRAYRAAPDRIGWPAKADDPD
jgi:hypothetical protein